MRLEAHGHLPGTPGGGTQERILALPGGRVRHALTGPAARRSAAAAGGAAARESGPVPGGPRAGVAGVLREGRWSEREQEDGRGDRVMDLVPAHGAHFARRAPQLYMLKESRKNFIGSCAP